jgi:hypothetical protein
MDLLALAQEHSDIAVQLIAIAFGAVMGLIAHSIYGEL